jgi:hypothetical protein
MSLNRLPSLRRRLDITHPDSDGTSTLTSSPTDIDSSFEQEWELLDPEQQNQGQRGQEQRHQKQGHQGQSQRGASYQKHSHQEKQAQEAIIPHFPHQPRTSTSQGAAKAPVTATPEQKKPIYPLSEGAIAFLLFLQGLQEGGTDGTGGQRTLHVLTDDFDAARYAISSQPNHAHLNAFFNEKLRYDWTPEAKKFTVLMPTPVHECVIIDLAILIDAGLKTLPAKAAAHRQPLLDRLTQIASKVKCIGSSDVKLHGPPPTRVQGSMSPDLSYDYHPSKFPTFVVEVGFSQDKESLLDKAEAYLKNSGGHIKTILTLDIQYDATSEAKSESGAKSESEVKFESEESAGVSSEEDSPPPTLHRKITLTKWCQKIENGKAKAQPNPYETMIRDSRGIIDAGTLQLCLSDFVPSSCLERILGTTDILSASCTFDIPFSALVAAVQEGENRIEQRRELATPEPLFDQMESLPRPAKRKRYATRKEEVDQEQRQDDKYETESPSTSPKPVLRRARVCSDEPFLANARLENQLSRKPSLRLASRRIQTKTSLSSSDTTLS